MVLLYIFLSCRQGIRFGQLCKANCILVLFYEIQNDMLIERAFKDQLVA